MNVPRALPLRPSAVLVLLATLPLLFAVVPATAQEEPEELPATTALDASVTVAGRPVRAAVARSAVGPLFELAPLVRVLGGELEPGPEGAGRQLTLGDATVLFGAGSGAVTRDREIFSLSQPPRQTERGLLVPLDFLELTYGELAGWSFDWDARSRRLEGRRVGRREVDVDLDLVHIQGVTTVVLRFDERPRYSIEERAGSVVVELGASRVSPGSERRDRFDDPRVRSIDVGRDRIRIDLAPGAAADSYTLDSPFRLVFDVHERSAAAPPPPAAAGEDGETGRGSTAPAAPPRRRRPGVHTIVLDPGHGGSETGAIGPGGTEEKALTLRLAQALKTRLEARMPVRVILTREEDANLPHDTRAAIANQNKGDLFVSIHLNSSVGPSAHGAETYFLSREASDERAERSARTENRSQEADGAAAGPAEGEDPLYDLQLILWDLAQSRHLAESQEVARLIQAELNEALDLRDRGVKQAPFRVLMGAAMPAVLVELGFLSNPEEEERLLDPGYRAELVDALARAIAAYAARFDETPEPAGEAAAGATPRDGGAGSPGEEGAEP